MNKHIMTFHDCYRYLYGKFIEWHMLSGGNLPYYVQNNKDSIRSHLNNDEFRSIICDFFSNLSGQKLNRQFNEVIKIAKRLTTIPPLSLTQLEIDILIEIMLEICGRHEQAKKFLTGTLGTLGFMLTVLVINSFIDANQRQNKHSKTRSQKPKPKARSKKSR